MTERFLLSIFDNSTMVSPMGMRARLFRNYGWSCVAVFLGGFSARFFFFEGFSIWEWSVLSCLFWVSPGLL